MCRVHHIVIGGVMYNIAFIGNYLFIYLFCLTFKISANRIKINKYITRFETIIIIIIFRILEQSKFMLLCFFLC